MDAVSLVDSRNKVLGKAAGRGYGSMLEMARHIFRGDEKRKQRREEDNAEKNSTLTKGLFLFPLSPRKKHSDIVGDRDR